MNKIQLAKAYGVSVVTVDAWLARGCPGKRGKRGWEFDLAEVAAWRASDLVQQRRRNKSGQMFSEMSLQLLNTLMLPHDQLIPWLCEDLLSYPDYQRRVGIDDAEMFALLMIGLPILPPAEGETVGRVSFAHAERWRMLLSIFLETIGADGYDMTDLGCQVMRLRGCPYRHGNDADEEAA